MEERKDDNLHERVYRLERMLIDMDNKLNQILQSSQNMDNHISFVERVYDIIRSPLNFLTTNLTNFIKIYPQIHVKEVNLPLLHDKKKEQ